MEEAENARRALPVGDSVMTGEEGKEGREDLDRIRRLVEGFVEKNGIPSSFSDCVDLAAVVVSGKRGKTESAQILDHAAADDPALSAIVALLAEGKPRLSQILPLWRSRQRDQRSCSPRPYRLLSERLVKMGENLLAYDVASEGLNLCGTHTRLRQLKALSLARSGATQRALRIFHELEEEGCTDAETIGMLGRLYKDLWESDPTGGRSEEYLQRSRDYYKRAYDISGDSWPGINAATMALVSGRSEEAESLAKTVESECTERLQSTGEDQRYWLMATLGEAWLVRGRFDRAVEWYEKAVELAGKNYGDVASTRRNAVLILEHIDCDSKVRESVLESLRTARIALFSGHMVDDPHRAVPRFPSHIEELVRDTLREELSKAEVDVGFASAACGADIIFHEILHELGGETHVVLPYGRDEFVQDSVGKEGSPWVERFDRVLTWAKDVTQVSFHKLDDEALSYEYTNMVLLGRALMQAEMLSGKLIPVAVWDGGEGDGPGGTSSNVRRWRELGLEVTIIDTNKLLAEAPSPTRMESKPTSGRAEKAAKPSPKTAEIRAILFADIAGYTELSEHENILFVEDFMTRVADLAESSPHGPLVSNTWGDGIFMVFETVTDGGLFALDLADLVESVSWRDMGLSRDLSIRIGLHAGPVHRCIDPVTSRPNYYGAHVGYAARLEPITAPGHVYASRQFAAVAACRGSIDFRCDYVGRVPFSKGYGVFPTYHVRRV